jgi:hypothetical protein
LFELECEEKVNISTFGKVISSLFQSAKNIAVLVIWKICAAIFHRFAATSFRRENLSCFRFATAFPSCFRRRRVSQSDSEKFGDLISTHVCQLGVEIQYWMV